MTSKTTLKLDLENYTQVLSSLSHSESTFISDLTRLKSTSFGKFDVLRRSITILATICDFPNVHGSDSSLSNLKKATFSVLTHLLDPLIHGLLKPDGSISALESEDHSLILGKWWLTYLALLNVAFSLKRKSPRWGDSLAEWFPSIEARALQSTLEALDRFYEQKIALLRGLLLVSKPGRILEAFMSQTQWKVNLKSIRDFYRSFVSKKLDQASLEPNKKDKHHYRIVQLSKLKQVLGETEAGLIRDEELLRVMGDYRE